VAEAVMSRGLSTLLLLVVALGIGAYVYFVESGRKTAAEREQEKPRVFAELAADDIDRLEVKVADGDSTTLEKENGVWKLTAPVATEADASEVSALTSNLVSAEVQRVVEEQPTDLAKYGLAPPRTEVVFETGSGEPRRLLLGEKTPTGSDLYAKLGSESRVFLLSGFLESTFKRSTFDLRDKALLEFDRDAVKEIELASAERTIRFVKDGDMWRMTAPRSARADYGSVEGLIGRIDTGRMSSLAADTPEALASFGLERPTKSITFVAGSGRSSLLVGDKTPAGQYYAKDAARPLVFTVDAALLEDLDKPPDDFRLKDVYEFRTYNGVRFEIVRDATTTVFEKTTPEGESTPPQWVQTQPAATGIESSKIDDFLSRMANLRATSFLDNLPPGTTEVARTIAVRDEGQKRETVTFYRVGDALYAVREAEPGAVLLAASDYENAIKVLDELKTNPT
jgi:hypothetical protein